MPDRRRYFPLVPVFLAGLRTVLRLREAVAFTAFLPVLAGIFPAAAVAGFFLSGRAFNIPAAILNMSVSVMMPTRILPALRTGRLPMWWVTSSRAHYGPVPYTFLCEQIGTDSSTLSAAA